MNYSEYNCPCGGRIDRVKVSTKNIGIFKDKIIFTYYYECTNCDIVSKHFKADITHKFK